MKTASEMMSRVMSKREKTEHCVNVWRDAYLESMRATGDSEKAIASAKSALASFKLYVLGESI